MKLWDVVAVCLVLLHTASSFPLPAGKRPPEAPAEDRSLGRRRAPLALSSDCKNRSLPAGGAPDNPPPPLPARRPHAPPASRADTAAPPEQSRAGRNPSQGLLPKVPGPSLCMANAGLPCTEGINFYVACLSFH